MLDSSRVPSARTDSVYLATDVLAVGVVCRYDITNASSPPCQSECTIVQVAACAS